MRHYLATGGRRPKPDPRLLYNACLYPGGDTTSPPATSNGDLPGLRPLACCQEETKMSERADFRQFYRDAHAVRNLSEREKILLGLAVAMVRNCQP